MGDIVILVKFWISRAKIFVKNNFLFLTILSSGLAFSAIIYFYINHFLNSNIISKQDSKIIFQLIKNSKIVNEAYSSDFSKFITADDYGRILNVDLVELNNTIKTGKFKKSFYYIYEEEQEEITSHIFINMEKREINESLFWKKVIIIAGALGLLTTLNLCCVYT